MFPCSKKQSVRDYLDTIILRLIKIPIVTNNWDIENYKKKAIKYLTQQKTKLVYKL